MLKKITVIALAFGLCTASYGQINTPAPSPTAKLTQMVALDEITVEYSRPGIKERNIFGGLLTYGKLWRTGANASTKITFPRDVNLAGSSLEAGTYSIFTIPKEDSWTVIFNKNENARTGNYDKEQDALRIEVKPMKLEDKRETFTIDFEHFTAEGAHLYMAWENTKVSIPITTMADKMVKEQIQKVMAGPSARDYYAAASYYLDKGENLDAAKEYIDKAVEGYNKYWVLRKQAMIYAANGEHKKAIEFAEKSKAMAAEAGNDDYVKMNDASIKEWKKKK